jgi:hypothetical protein
MVKEEPAVYATSKKYKRRFSRESFWQKNRYDNSNAQSNNNKPFI